MRAGNIYRRIAATFHRARQERELREEMQQHLELKIEDNLAAGMPPAEARQAALREFGNPTLLCEQSHDHWKWALMETLAQDLRYAFRLLRRAPSFSVAAVLTLALGIAATTIMFGVLQAVVFRAVPYPDAARLLAVHETDLQQRSEPFEVSYPNYLGLRDQAKSFQQLAAYMFDTATLRTESTPRLVGVGEVSANLFDALHAQPELGRVIASSEDRRGAQRVTVISHRIWQEMYGGDPSVLGRSVVLDGAPHTIVGVLPANFYIPGTEVDFWTALGVKTDSFLQRRSAHTLGVVGRLKPGVSRADAASELDRLASRLQHDFPGEDPQHGIAVRSLQDELAGSSRLTMYVLFGAVSLLLLISCLNVANLVLVRLASRWREIGVRVALGAARRRVVRQFVIENLLLALLGGGAGTLLAFAGVSSIRGALVQLAPRAAVLRLDWTVLAFACGVSLLTGAVLGTLSALQGSRLACNPALDQARGSSSRSASRAGRVFVAAQVAVTLVLLAGAGLMISSLRRVLAVNPGFRQQDVLTTAVTLPQANIHTRAQLAEIYRQITSALAALPGAREASAVSSLPMSGGDSQGELTIEGQSMQPGAAPGVGYLRSLPGYFHVMEIPILEGRDFSERDDGHPMVTLISAAMARRYWPGRSPIGARIKVGDAASEPWLTVIGVVGDVRHAALDVEPAMTTYEPEAQRPRLTMRFVVRTSVPPATLAAAAEKAVHQVQNDAVVFETATLEQRVSASVLPRRAEAALLGGFAVLALLLAAVGMYGVISYAVVLRTREIGIRVALGSGRSAVLRLVLGDSLRLFAIGALVGLAGALAATRAMAGLLFGISAHDPATFALAVLLLAAVVVLASAAPARRASSVDPMVALRYE